MLFRSVNGFYINGYNEYGNTYSSSFLNISSANVQNGDTATLFTGQQARGITVSSGGAMIINSGAKAAYDTYVSSGGNITVHAGADFDWLSVSSGAKVNGFYLQYQNTYSSSFLNISAAQVQNGDTATLFTGQ